MTPQTQAGRALLRGKRVHEKVILAIEQEAAAVALERVRAAVFAVDATAQVTNDELLAILDAPHPTPDLSDATSAERGQADAERWAAEDAVEAEAKEPR